MTRSRNSRKGSKNGHRPAHNCSCWLCTESFRKKQIVKAKASKKDIRNEGAEHDDDKV